MTDDRTPLQRLDDAVHAFAAEIGNTGTVGAWVVAYELRPDPRRTAARPPLPRSPMRSAGSPRSCPSRRQQRPRRSGIRAHRLLPRRTAPRHGTGIGAVRRSRRTSLRGMPPSDQAPRLLGGPRLHARPSRAASGTLDPVIRRRRDPLRPDEHRELLAMIGATTAGIIVLILVTIGYLITPR